MDFVIWIAMREELIIVIFLVEQMYKSGQYCYGMYQQSIEY